MMRTTKILITRTSFTTVFFAVVVISTFQPKVACAANDAVNPHWSKSACQTCHVEAAPTAGNLSFHEPEVEKTCEGCHGDRGDARPCRHVSGIPVGDIGVSESHTRSLQAGNIVCSTCHDLTVQCLNPSKSYRYTNPPFLRDRKSRHQGDYCYQCHEDSNYEKLNPHQGVAGDPPRATCPLCHTGIPESDGGGGVSVSFNMQRDLNDTCRGCHDVRPHPTGMSFGSQGEGWVHLVKPSADVFGKIEKWQATTGSSLPLSPYDGEIYCATCHNPHEFKGGPVAERPAHRLRADNICQVCHEK